MKTNNAPVIKSSGVELFLIKIPHFSPIRREIVDMKHKTADNHSLSWGLEETLNGNTFTKKISK